MENHNLLYNPNISDFSDSSSDDGNCENFLVQKKKTYELNNFQFIVDTIDRNLDVFENPFDFQVNTSQHIPINLSFLTPQ